MPLIKFDDLKREIVRLVHENLDYKVINNEGKKGLPENFFFVRFLSSERESLNNDQDLRTYTVELQFREKDNNKLAQMGDQLTDLFFYSLAIGDRVLLINYNEWPIDEDKDLFFRFSLSFTTAKDKNRREYMAMQEMEMQIERSY